MIYVFTNLFIVNFLNADILDDTIKFWYVDKDYKHTTLYIQAIKTAKNTKNNYIYYKQKNPYRAAAIESLVETGIIVVGIAGIVEVGAANSLTYVLKNYKVLVPTEVKSIRRMTTYEKKIITDGQQVKLNNVTVIQRNHIFRKTPANLALMRAGKPPIGIDGEPVQLHHMKQQNRGLIIEILAKDEHRIEYKKLHRYTNKTEINRSRFNAFRTAYWKERSK